MLSYCNLYCCNTVLWSEDIFAHCFSSQTSMQSMGIQLWSLSQKGWRPSCLVRLHNHTFEKSEINQYGILFYQFVVSNTFWREAGFTVALKQGRFMHLFVRIQEWAVSGEPRNFSGDFRESSPHKRAMQVASHQTPLTKRSAQVLRFYAFV